MEEEVAIEHLLLEYIKELKRLFAELQEDTGRRKDVTLEIERLKSRMDRGLIKKRTGDKAQ